MNFDFDLDLDLDINLDFDLDLESKDKKIEEIRQKKRDYTAKIKYNEILLKSVKSFSEIIGTDISENCQLRIVTERSFNAISVLSYIYDNFDIKEMYIAVYRMNIQSVEKIKEFLKDDKFHCKIILSSFFRENKKYERWCKELEDYAKKKKNCELSFAWSHAKVFLAKTKCGKHIVFEGSGNLSDNARIEQYIYEDNKKVYYFHKNWMDELNG